MEAAYPLKFRPPHADVMCRSSMWQDMIFSVNLGDFFVFRLIFLHYSFWGYKGGFGVWARTEEADLELKAQLLPPCTGKGW